MFAFEEFFRMIAPVLVLAVPSVRLEAAVSVMDAKVGVEDVAIDWGSERTMVLPAPLSVSVIWFAVPVRTRSFVSVAFVVSVT